MNCKQGDLAVIVGSDYEDDPDIGKVVECLEAVSVEGFADDEGVIWRVDRMLAQWDVDTEEREPDLPYIGDRWLMPIGTEAASRELAAEASETGEPK